MTARPRARVRIGDLWIDALTMPSALDAIEALVARRHGGSVLTPNVDHVVRVERDLLLRRAYALADLSLADGQPIVWASRLLRTPLPEKISGSDLVGPLLARAAARGWRVYLLGGARGSAEAARARLFADPGVSVCGAEGPRVSVEPGADEAALVDRIRESNPQLILVGLGCPKQERFIARNAARFAPAVCLGIGASIDFIAGAVARAPRWVSRAGLEWLFRLAQEPRRLARRYLLEDPRFAAIVWHTLRSDACSLR